MAENSNIEWTTHTFNPWRGCTKISPGCAHCYAETLSGRNPKTLGVWGPNGKRVVAAESQWRLPLKWDREAKEAGERRRVFCASLADVFEDWQGRMHVSNGHELWKDRQSGVWEEDEGEKDYAYYHSPVTVQDVRNRLFAMIDDTPYLDWLLLTKRPENIAKMMPPMPVIAGRPLAHRPNVWIGVSVEDQERADERIPHLLRTPATVRFLSVEPLLGPLNIEPFLQYPPFHEHYKMTVGPRDFRGIDWVIVGGESGPGARPCDVAWIRSIVKQCKEAGVPCFVKQVGSVPVIKFDSDDTGIHGFAACDFIDRGNGLCVPKGIDRKGGTMEEWPADLRVREFPRKDMP